MTQRHALAAQLIRAFRDPRESSFNAQIFRLMPKADLRNRIRLKRGFPELWSVYVEWRDLFTEAAFCERYDIT